MATSKLRRFNRVDFVIARDMPTIDIDLPEIEGRVTLRAFSQKEIAEIGKVQAEAEKKKKTDFNINLYEISLAAIDENGEATFGGEDGMAMLLELPKIVIDRLTTGILVLNNITEYNDYVTDLKKTIGGVVSSNSVSD